MKPPEIDISRVRRILIVKLSAIGDIVHALPVSAALGHALPNVELTWAVEEANVPLLSGNPYLTDIFVVPRARGGIRTFAKRREYFGALRELGERKFDLAIDLQGLSKSAVVALASGAPARIGYHWLREAARLWVYPTPLHAGSVHVVQHYLDVVRYIGVVPERVEFPFHIPEQDLDLADAMLAEAGLGSGAAFASINPASAAEVKQWGVERYAALADRIHCETGLPCALVTADRQVAAAVVAAARRPIVNLAGRTNLKQLAAVLMRSAVHVCGDTGSGHLAAALDTPVISLFGPTDPDRTCPYGQRDNVLKESSVCASRCDRRRCEFAKARCLDALTVETVAERTLGALTYPPVRGPAPASPPRHP